MIMILSMEVSRPKMRMRMRRKRKTKTSQLLSLLLLLVLVNLVSLFVSLIDAQQTVEPKLVCYYTNWSKDRPVPWSYVSSKISMKLIEIFTRD